MILAGTVPYWGFAGWDDIDRDPAELHLHLLVGPDHLQRVPHRDGTDSA
jgi:hypothetical protein